MDNKFLGIRKISSSQKTDLINTGSTTVNGTTKTVQNDVIYLAPDIDSELLKMDADGNVTTVKAFVSPRDLTLTIGTKGKGYIDWGDGTIDIISADGSLVHTYSTANIYLVKMYGFNAITSFDNQWYGYMGLVEFVDYIEENENGSLININPEYFPLIRVGMKLYFTHEKDVSIPNVTATIIAIGEDNACILDTDVVELVPMGGHAYLSPVPDSTTIFPNPIYEANVSKFLDPATATFLAQSSDGAQCAKKIIVPYEQLENYKTTYADFTGVDTSNIFDSYAFVSETKLYSHRIQLYIDDSDEKQIDIEFEIRDNDPNVFSTEHWSYIVSKFPNGTIVNNIGVLFSGPMTAKFYDDFSVQLYGVVVDSRGTGEAYVFNGLQCFLVDVIDVVTEI